MHKKNLYESHLQVEVLATDALGTVGQVDDVGLGGELDGGAPDDVVAVVGAGDGHLVDEDPDDLPALVVGEARPGRARPNDVIGVG